jgi:hypothetical protein
MIFSLFCRQSFRPVSSILYQFLMSWFLHFRKKHIIWKNSDSSCETQLVTYIYVLSGNINNQTIRDLYIHPYIGIRTLKVIIPT